MRLDTFMALAQSGRLRALHTLAGIAPEVYRASFLVAAGRCGLLRALAGGPVTAAGLRTALGIAADAADGFEAWLAVGAAIGELREADGRWRLAGRLARMLVAPENDDLLAVLEECVDLHVRLVEDAPRRLQEGRRFTLSDQDGLVIARSSRVLEPLIHEAIDRVVPRAGGLRLLEVGCGSATYIRHALARNADLDVVGLELQPQVAAMARSNLAAWGLGERVAIEVGDVRGYASPDGFDLVTLHNNVYYFPADARVALFRHLADLLHDGGTLLVTTACAGGSPAVAVLSLWGAMTDGCGALPRPETLTAQLRAAGFEAVGARNLARPWDRFYAFTARRPARAVH